MITINPVKLNNPITFRENTENFPNSALIRPLQGPAAGTPFEQKVFEQKAMDDYKLSMEADAVQNNPLKAAYKKFVKAYKVLFPAHETNIDQHIMYMA